jgi:hypothetical protein
MEIILEYLILSLVLAAVFAYIAYPILKPPPEEIVERNALDPLVTERESAYQAIRDLDFDFQLGKLSATDYETLRERQKSHAAAVLQEIDALGQPQIVQAAPTREPKIFCTNCGTLREPDDKFCRKCGNPLK